MNWIVCFSTLTLTVDYDDKITQKQITKMTLVEFFNVIRMITIFIHAQVLNLYTFLRYVGTTADMCSENSVI